MVKLRSKGFSLNGHKNLKTIVVPYDEDHDIPMGVEWNVDLSTDKGFETLVEGLFSERMMKRDEARRKVRELIQQLQLQRDEALRMDSTPKNERTSELSARFPGLVDLVEVDGAVKFLVLDDGVMVQEDQHEEPGKLLLPPPAEHIQWHLPRSGEVFQHYRHDDDQTLYADLVTYFKGVSQMPTELHYTLLALWLIHGYLLENFWYSPYLYLWAVPERGKSRTARAVIYAAYRGLVTETLQEANLFRWSNDLGASIAFDVKDLWRKAEKRGSDDVLLQRFEKGAKVGRVIWPERGKFRDTQYYDVFGATIVAANELPVEPLLSRCIVVTMPEATQHFPENVVPELGLPYRERLTALRARWLDEELPGYDKPVRGRLGDMLQPLGQIAAKLGPEILVEFRKLADLLQSERMEDRAGSREARLVSIICGLRDENEEGKIGVKAITAAYNEGLAEKRQLSPESIGRRLKALGFVSDRLKDRTRAIIPDESLLRALKAKYGLGDTLCTRCRRLVSTEDIHFYPPEDGAVCVDCSES